jgi:hypothetical protein
MSQGGKFVLNPGTYLIDRQYQLPPGTEIIGAGSEEGGTLIRAVGADYSSVCDEDAKNRKGFLLGSNTYIGHLRFEGMEKLRFCNNNLLCGGAPFETPGCASTGIWSEAPKSCSKTGDGRGVHNATIEDIWIEPLTVQNAVYIAPTARGAPVSEDITIKRVVTYGTWADGLNIHGAHKNILVESCDLRNLGDDAYAIWSIGDGADNITFLNNRAEDPVYRPACHARKGHFKSTFCFAVYGGRHSRHLNNQCHGARSVVGYGGPWGNYGGSWAPDGSSFVTGVADLVLDACSYGSPPPFNVSCSIDVLEWWGPPPPVGLTEVHHLTRWLKSPTHGAVFGLFVAASAIVFCVLRIPRHHSTDSSLREPFLLVV